MSRRSSSDLGLAGASDMTAAEAARYEHMPSAPRSQHPRRGAAFVGSAESLRRVNPFLAISSSWRRKYFG
jgi:hypothetical protein